MSPRPKSPPKISRLAGGAEQETTTRETTLTQEAYGRIRLDILRGNLSPGSPLRLEALKQRYGFSFSPLREALTRLHSERLVKSSALRGFRVAPISLNEMWDSIETRILIDGEGLHLSVKNGDDDWEASVIAAFHSLSRCAARLRSLERDRTDSESEELEARHRAFHFALINASSRRWLLEFSSLLYDQTERYRRPFLAGSELSYERDVHAEHEEIMDSTIARQAEKAAKLLAAHYRRTGDLIEEKLRQSDAEDLSLADPE